MYNWEISLKYCLSRKALSVLNSRGILKRKYALKALK